ncbi:TPA: hypothetical protein ACIABJ_004765, partial [Escherichia coli]
RLCRRIFILSKKSPYMETGKTERKVIIQHVNNNRMLQTVATKFLLHSGWHVSNSFARISH